MDIHIQLVLATQPGSHFTYSLGQNNFFSKPNNHKL